MLPELLNQIPPDQEIGSIPADGAYDTCKCHGAIAARQACAVIPPRKNAKLWKPTSDGAIARNDAVKAQRYLGRTVWRRRKRISPSKSLRNQDAFYEPARPIVDDEGLQKASCRNSNPHRCPQPLHGSWLTYYSTRRLRASGVRGKTSFSQFLQQSPEHYEL